MRTRAKGGNIMKWEEKEKLYKEVTDHAYAMFRCILQKDFRTVEFVPINGQINHGISTVYALADVKWIIAHGFERVTLPSDGNRVVLVGQLLDLSDTMSVRTERVSLREYAGANVSVQADEEVDVVWITSDVRLQNDALLQVRDGFLRALDEVKADRGN